MARSLREHGATAESDALWHQVRPLLRFMERSPNYVALCKAGLALQGFDVGAVREPYLMPERAETQELGRLLRAAADAFRDSPLKQ